MEYWQCSRTFHFSLIHALRINYTILKDKDLVILQSLGKHSKWTWSRCLIQICINFEYMKAFFLCSYKFSSFPPLSHEYVISHSKENRFIFIFLEVVPAELPLRRFVL